jgi:hypothetical protein
VSQILVESERELEGISTANLLTSSKTSSYQEDFHSFATLSLNPEELRATVSRHLGIDWDPESVGHPFSRQVVFVGIYDG